ncbi:MAG: M48 family metallopeptidase, partial [Clostridiales bacterium]|nr:M48 family metallopeptidase [Clostridiales bacterium]
MNFVYYNGTKIEYLLERKNVKNINLRVKRDLSVKVSAPAFVSQKIIDNFVVLNGGRILSALEKFSADNETEKKYLSGEIIYILGKPYVLDVKKDKYSHFCIQNGKIILYLKYPDNYKSR